MPLKSRLMESFLDNVLSSGNININNQYKTCYRFTSTHNVRYISSIGAQIFCKISKICIGICERKEKFEGTKGLIRITVPILCNLAPSYLLISNQYTVVRDILKIYIYRCMCFLND